MKRKIIVFLLSSFILIGCTSETKPKEVSFYENTEETKLKKSGTYYEIFVRSYADSDGDGIGDLNGIRENLKELSELGVEGIWLTPIFQSPSYHKYDVTDYYKIDKEYGTIEDLKNLVKEAHDKKIKVIIDMPINHTSHQHSWFKDVLKNKDSQYKSYYRITDKDNKKINTKSIEMGHKSWNKLNDQELYYALFSESMPDLNFSNQKVRDEMKKIGQYWLKETGLDGYRLDAAAHIYGKAEYSSEIDSSKENINWWAEYREAMRKTNKDVYLVGEVWMNSNIVSQYYKVFDSNFNFDLSENGITKAILMQSAGGLSTKIPLIYDSYKQETKNYIDAPFLSNHDQNRIAQTLESLSQQKLAASILLTLPGNPFIYYGEELGMKGQKPDENIREGYVWGNKYQTKWQASLYNKQTTSLLAQKKNAQSLYNHYKKMIQLRKSNSALKYGDFLIAETKDDQVLAFYRQYKDKKSLVVHNLSDKEKSIEIDNKNIKLSAYSTHIL
ncbi:hypothetical protein HMPREF9943_00899 [Eggerthia catenaformis OT 569 = DSM 20559]|uniref:Glycosyl hydrolase family 13 catalytic domain-containing protein n=1 Tax=Eggerthia catenaformis OT 569 = DSM 20559 TaxID=999415 RepID=M2P923_9FIRM|nr:alpha-amylase family glycosyl hydrolase [Eggerthia catenaformis]EMD16857.1 hypothetical protein HMPREF9943_00899 [Eggerthia catenaformis OT 569 = DSM 20559]